MVEASASPQVIYYCVDELRGDESLSIICGLRRLQPDALLETSLVLEVSSRVDARIEEQLGIHLQSSNYDDSTTRLVGVFVPVNDPSKLFRVQEDRSLKYDRTFDGPLLLIEVAGANANRAERGQLDDKVLMYQPSEFVVEKPRPWWKFW